MISKFNLTVPKSETPKMVEVFDFKNKANQEKFREATSTSTYLSEVFETTENINIQTKQFIKRLNKCIHKSFKKIRIGKRKPSEYERLYAKWTEIKHKEDNENKLESLRLETELADKFGDNIFEKIKEEIQDMNCEDGRVNSGKLWKLKKKFHKGFSDPPTAMKDGAGKLLTEKEDILEETVKHYTKVLDNRKIKEGLENHQKERENLANLRLEQARKKEKSRLGHGRHN